MLLTACVKHKDQFEWTHNIQLQGTGNDASWFHTVYLCAPTTMVGQSHHGGEVEELRFVVVFTSCRLGMM